MNDNPDKNQSEPHLKVYLDRSILVGDSGQEEFLEGTLSQDAKQRLLKIKNALKGGYFAQLIEECKRPDALPGELPPEHLKLLERMVESVTSEVGRALVGLTLIQLCIKDIVPEQSIRLHKGGTNRSPVNFSWRDGIPMRSLDKDFFTPMLRKNDLLRVNADGVMMTRSLAENYPYSKLYKAALRGAKEEWLEIVELLENASLNPNVALRYMIAMLINRNEAFLTASQAMMGAVKKIVAARPSARVVIDFIHQYVDRSDYSARVFEIAMHSLYQALEDWGLLEGNLKPLSQMRSANKKHGNIGDVEVTVGTGALEILEAWDGKYGKPYLRDELEELSEKLQNHMETKLVGFVVDREPLFKQEIADRMQEIEDLYNVKVRIAGFDKWAYEMLSLADNQNEIEKLASDWLIAFAESLGQLRRDRAPIDEPCNEWVKQLHQHADLWVGRLI